MVCAFHTLVHTSRFVNTKCTQHASSNQNENLPVFHRQILQFWHPTPMIFRNEGDEDLRKIDPGYEEGKRNHHQEQENLVVAKASNVGEEIIEIKVFLWCFLFWISSFQTLFPFKVWGDFVRHITLVRVPNRVGYQYLFFNTLIHSNLPG